MKRKVLLVGWDAADWKIIDSLIEQGKMPHLAKLIEGGVRGNMATLYPVLSPMLWTSIATGKWAYKHGIYGFVEPDLKNQKIKPMTVLNRQCKAIWNILNQSGLKSNVIGWWPSHPAEPINGMIVSDYLNKGTPSSPNQEWEIQSGLVHPKRLEKYVAELRIHPQEIEGEMVLPFIPNAPSIEQKKDGRLMTFAKVLSHCSSIHAISTAAIQLEPWDFMAVYHDAIDHFSHSFMRYHPPRLDWIKEEDFEMYKGVIEGAYCYHDMMLGVLLQLAGKDTTVIVMSDHGFRSDDLRPRFLPNEATAPAAEHRQYGIFVANGPGIREDELLFGARLLDIAPTILSLFDLPIGRDMDGRPLLDIYEKTPEVHWIDSWEEIKGDDGMHSDETNLSPKDEANALKQLADLGYINPLDEDVSKNIENVTKELDYNLALSCQFCGRLEQAVSLYQSLWEKFPEEARYGLKIFECYYILENPQKARETLLKILLLKKKYRKTYAQSAQKILSGIKKNQRNKGKEDENIDIELLTKEEQKELFERAEKHKNLLKLFDTQRRRALLNWNTLFFLRGKLYLLEKEYDKAIWSLQKALQAQIYLKPDVLMILAKAYEGKKDDLSAIKQYRRALKLDPENSQAYIGLASALMPRFPLRAATFAKKATGLLYFSPQAHLLAGIGFLRVRRLKDAFLSFEIAVVQSPHLLTVIEKEIHRFSQGFSRKLWAMAKINSLRSKARKSLALSMRVKEKSEEMEKYDFGFSSFERGKKFSLKESAVIVSGLPRSGTSLMMQMLKAGGLELLDSGKRIADDSNPQGYCEHEKIKDLPKDNVWFFPMVKGKSVKVILQLLEFLPKKQPYRLIVMHRNLTEVVESQHKMLKRQGKQSSNKKTLMNTYAKQIRFLEGTLEKFENCSVCTVSYKEAVEDSFAVAQRLNVFLDGHLNVNKMVEVVNKNLYRERSENNPSL